MELSDPGIELGSPALQVDSLPAELPGKLLIMKIDTMKRKHIRGDPNASFLFAKKGNEYVDLLFCFVLFYFLWLHHVACGILVSRPGIKLCSDSESPES